MRIAGVGRYALDAEGTQAVEVEGQLGDAVAPMDAPVLAHVGGVVIFTEGTACEFGGAGAAQIRPAARHRSRALACKRAGLRIEPVPGAPEPPKVLDDGAVPAGDVADEFFEDPQRALAAAVVDRLGYVYAAAACVEYRDQPGADEVGQVRHGPVVAELDELIVPQAVVASPHNGCLPGQDLHERAQDVRVVREAIFVAIDAGDHLPQLLREVLFKTVVCGVRHRMPPFR